MDIEIKPINKHIKNFIGFATVGIVTTILSLLLIVILIEIFKLQIILAYPIVYISSILLSYYLNKDYVFKYNGNRSKLVLYVIIYITAMLLGIFLIGAIKEVSAIKDTIIALIILPITTLYNFTLVTLLFKTGKPNLR